MHYIITTYGYIFVTFSVILHLKITFFLVFLNFFAKHKKSPVLFIGQGRNERDGQPVPYSGMSRAPSPTFYHMAVVKEQIASPASYSCYYSFFSFRQVQMRFNTRISISWKTSSSSGLKSCIISRSNASILLSTLLLTSSDFGVN